MKTQTTKTTRTTTLTRVLAVSAGLVMASTVATTVAHASTPMSAFPQTATPTATSPAPMRSGSLLTIEEVRGAGPAVDSAQLDSTGSALLGDAGRFDEGCLGEKTIRNITGSKSYPARGTATAYFDGTWTSTTDKDVWLREAIAEGRDEARTNRYVATLRMAIVAVKSCQQDPAQGHSYGPATTVRVGSATAEYYVDYAADGSSNGAGVAIIRDGTRFGYVDLLSGRGTTTLRQVAVAAARQLR